MNETIIDLEHHDGIAVIRVSRPPEGYIDIKGAQLLTSAVQVALGDSRVKVVILTGGQPDSFIRHADVSQIVRAAEGLQSGSIQPEDFGVGPFVDLTRMLESADKPIIAAINGVCMGGGLEIALACTMRIASKKVSAIGLPEIRIGIFPGAGGIERAARLIGWHRARLMVLHGSVLDADAARAIGLVDEVAPNAFAHALTVAQDIARRSSGAITAILRLVRDQSDHSACAVAFGRHLQQDESALPRLQRFVAEDIPLQDC